jgi:plastocyanin
VIRRVLGAAALTAAAALALAGCGSSSRAPGMGVGMDMGMPTAAATQTAHAAQAAAATPATAIRHGHVTVSITNYAFTPAKLTVAAGTRVTFVNHDMTAHTATADRGGFGTGTIAPHHRGTIRLSKPGRYPYHCLFHAFMTGTITVARG